LPDGRIVCVGGNVTDDQFSSGEVYGPPELGAPDAAWTWRQLSGMSFGRLGCRGCLMSDGRFAVLGGYSPGLRVITPSCQALTSSDASEHWEPLPAMHDPRSGFACQAVAGCIIVAGGHNGVRSAEVYDEVLRWWLRLPHDLPSADGLSWMGSALV
jgi:hypothetical protein